jgi:hypothetical protein
LRANVASAAVPNAIRRRPSAPPQPDLRYGVVAEPFFDQHLIGLHALQYPYLEVRSKNALAALCLMVLAASVAFTYLLKAGLVGV